MIPAIEALYDAWVCDPKPHLWPDYLRDHPMKAHGLYCFREGLRLGLLLASDAFLSEIGP